ncbi:MAG TPA: hypothetical protein VEX64_05645, partial [Pyrinomonadaceae bacterium]|nr:hypothetical protein [Pyrinomonadaceae bacterium]
MNDSARQKLVGLVAAQGKSIIENPRRAEGLFRDHFGAYRREISVLKMALEEHVGLDLLAATPQTPRAVLLSRLSRRLCDNLALSEEAAEWAVNSWALALGVISEADLKTIEQQSLSQTPAASPTASQNKTAQTKSAVSSGAVAATTQQKSPPVRSSASTEIIVSADGSGDYVSINEAIRAAKNGSR